jgi:hypothetical protein
MQLVQLAHELADFGGQVLQPAGRAAMIETVEESKGSKRSRDFSSLQPSDAHGIAATCLLRSAVAQLGALLLNSIVPENLKFAEFRASCSIRAHLLTTLPHLPERRLPACAATNN